MSMSHEVPTKERPLSAKEFSAWAGISLRHTRRLIAAGRLPVVRLGRRVLVAPDQLRFTRQRARADS